MQRLMPLGSKNVCDPRDRPRSLLEGAWAGGEGVSANPAAVSLRSDCRRQGPRTQAEMRPSFAAPEALSKVALLGDRGILPRGLRPRCVERGGGAPSRGCSSAQPRRWQPLPSPGLALTRQPELPGGQPLGWGARGGSEPRASVLPICEMGARARAGREGGEPGQGGGAGLVRGSGGRAGGPGRRLRLPPRSQPRAAQRHSGRRQGAAARRSPASGTARGARPGQAAAPGPWATTAGRTWAARRRSSPASRTRRRYRGRGAAGCGMRDPGCRGSTCAELRAARSETGGAGGVQPEPSCPDTASVRAWARLWAFLDSPRRQRSGIGAPRGTWGAPCLPPFLPSLWGMPQGAARTVQDGSTLPGEAGS